MHMQVLDWLRVVIDSHLPRLLMDKQPPAVMQGLQMALKRKVGMWISVDVCGYGCMCGGEGVCGCVGGRGEGGGGGARVSVCMYFV